MEKKERKRKEKRMKTNLDRRSFEKIFCFFLYSFAETKNITLISTFALKYPDSTRIISCAVPLALSKYILKHCMRIVLRWPCCIYCLANVLFSADGTKVRPLTFPIEVPLHCSTYIHTHVVGGVGWG